MRTVDVYCGAQTCALGMVRNAGTNVVTTRSWVSVTYPGSMPWDMAVIKVSKELPGTAYTPYMYNSSATFSKVTLTGFPYKNKAQAACDDRKYTGGCSQFSSTSWMRTALVNNVWNGTYTSATLDFCE